MGFSVSVSLSLGHPISLHCAETDINKQINKLMLILVAWIYFVGCVTHIYIRETVIVRVVC